MTTPASPKYAPRPWATEPLPSDPSAVRVYSIPLREDGTGADEVAICLDANDAALIVTLANQTTDEIASTLAEHFPRGYACGTSCEVTLNSPTAGRGTSLSNSTPARTCPD